MNNRWILTSEREPEKEGYYIVKTKYGENWSMYYCNGWNKHNNDDKYEIDSNYIKAWAPISALELLDLSSIEYHEIKALSSSLIKNPKYEIEEDRLNWIPASEKLPDPNKAVLTYIDYGMTKTYCLAYWSSTMNGWQEWLGYDMLERNEQCTVLAWMELPEPYKESEG